MAGYSPEALESGGGGWDYLKPDQACSRELKGVLQQPEGRLDRKGSQGGSKTTKSFVLQKKSLCG